jgi:monoterpene epsilon-lactone hydrolase
MSIHWVKFRRSIRGYLLNLILRLFVKRLFKPAPDSVTRLRQLMTKMEAPLAKLIASVDLRKEELGTCPATWVGGSKDTSEPIVLYLHGGAFFMRTPHNHLLFLDRLRAASKLKLVIPFYRLAPEYPFPAALEDSICAYQGLLDQGYLPDNIIIAGDSAGGNLAIALLQQLKILNRPMPNCAVLLSPGLDLSPNRIKADSDFNKDPVFPGDALEIVTDTYLAGDVAAGSDPRVSPMFGDFNDLPPLLFIAGSTELFLQDSIRACNSATDQGVDAKAMIWRGMPHCFPLMQPKFLPESAAAMKDIIEFINQNLKNTQDIN